MTTGTVIGAPPASPALSTPTYGVIASDTTGLAEVHGLFGGPGTARCKTLIPGQHLPGGGWSGIEYVELPPGARCGRPLRSACEEVYYIVRGTGRMIVNDFEEITVEAGDLIRCPLGTIHGIRVPDTAAQPLAYYMAAVRPGNSADTLTPYPGPSLSSRRADKVPMLARLDYAAPGWRCEGRDPDFRVATLDLSKTLTGPRRFSLIEIPADDNLGSHDLLYDLPLRTSEVLFVTAGTAEITVGNVTAKGATGLCVGVPLHARCHLRNPGDTELYVISTEVAV